MNNLSSTSSSKGTETRFWFRAAMFGAVVAVAWLGLYAVEGEDPRPSYIRDLDALLTSRPDVLVLGDSTVQHPNSYDPEQRNLGDWITEALSPCAVRVAPHPAFDMSVYADVVAYACAGANVPSVFIVPINLRSYSPTWHLRTEEQFYKLRLFLRHDWRLVAAVYRPLAVFQWFRPDPVPIREVQRVVSNHLYDVSGVLPEELAAKVEDGVLFADNLPTPYLMAANYGHSIGEDHKLVRAMARLMETAQGAGASVLFYVTPIDLELGASLLGNDLAEIARANSRFLAELAEARGATAVDLVGAQASDRFEHPPHVAEYLNVEGRREVAERIAEAFRDAGYPACLERNP